MAEPSQPASPLDPFLVQFLVIVQSRQAGFQPGPESSEIAARLDLPRPFMDALFTSARTRGLLKPLYGRGKKVRWALSPVGEEFIRRQGSPTESI